VIVSFRDKGTEDLFDWRDTKQARKTCPSDLVRVARRKLDQLNQAVALGDLPAPPSNHLEKLKGERRDSTRSESTISGGCASDGPNRAPKTSRSRTIT